MTNTLKAPSDFHVKAVCSTCGHVQYPYAILPVFEEDGEDVIMVECIVGSSGDFCDVCEDKGLPALTMEIGEWLHFDELPAEVREYYAS